jgi:hypothetical protein
VDEVLRVVVVVIVVDVVVVVVFVVFVPVGFTASSNLEAVPTRGS